MTLIVYIGPFESVEVEHQAGAPWAGTAYRGTPIEVPAHVAAGLLDQFVNWQPAPPPTVKRKSGETAEGSDQQ